MLNLHAVLTVLLVLVAITSADLTTTDAYAENNFTETTTRREDGIESGVSRLKGLLRSAKTDDGVIDLNILLRRNVKDPIPISDFNVSSSGVFTNIHGRFTDVQLHGLRDFSLKKMEMNLSRMNLSAIIHIPMLRFSGNYALDGTLTFISVSGEGGFWMNISDITLYGHSLVRSRSDGRMEMGEIKLFSNVNSIKLHFENLMGGGRWSSFSNSVLNQLSELILDELKHTLLTELSRFLKQQFNYVLLEYLPRGFMDPETTNIVDSVLKQMGRNMRQNGLDPFPLPDQKEKFHRRVLFIDSRGELELTDGSLHGLSSIYRKGDVVASFENNSICFDASFGFKNLTGGYDWKAHVFGVGPSGHVTIAVQSFEGYLRFKQDLISGSKLQLDTLNVTDIRQIWLDVSGLGTWDFVLEILINLITNGIKMNLADAIAGPVKLSIQNELDTFNISISR